MARRPFVSVPIVLVAVACTGALLGVQRWRAAEPAARARSEPTLETPPPRRASETASVRLPVTKEVAARPYNLVDEVLSRKRCHRGGSPIGPGDVIPLAIARAGSDTVIHTMQRWERKENAHEYGHDHTCTLADYAAKGARRVVISLREPVSRLISGFMRRMEGHAEHDYNKRFEKAFKTPDSYVTALVDPRDKLHREALEVTYGDGGTQNYMTPVVEFYLSLPLAKDHDAKSKELTYAGPRGRRRQSSAAKLSKTL